MLVHATPMDEVRPSGRRLHLEQSLCASSAQKHGGSIVLFGEEASCEGLHVYIVYAKSLHPMPFRWSKTGFLVLLLGPIMLGASGPVHSAVVLYTQGAPGGDTHGGVFSNGPASGARDQQLANRFTLPFGGTPTMLQWFGYQATTPNRVFLLRLYADKGGFPGTLLHEEPAAVVGANVGLAGFSYTAPFTPGNLEGGTTYWLSIIENDPLMGWGWIWSAFPSGAYDQATRFGESSPWHADNLGYDFTIFGIPEPWNLTFLGFGVLIWFGPRFHGSRRSSCIPSPHLALTPNKTVVDNRLPAPSRNDPLVYNL
jgi:hypothetical protein